MMGKAQLASGEKNKSGGSSSSGSSGSTEKYPLTIKCAMDAPDTQTVCHHIFGFPPGYTTISGKVFGTIHMGWYNDKNQSGWLINGETFTSFLEKTYTIPDDTVRIEIQFGGQKEGSPIGMVDFTVT